MEKARIFVQKMNPSESIILVVGANPAWERVLDFQEFAVGEVNRATGVGGYAAGKATNFCRALKCLGGRFGGRQLTFLGGETGRRFASGLAAEGMECQFVAIQEDTRTCTNCVCKGTMTELVEPGTPVGPKYRDAFLAMLEQNLPKAVGVAITGSVPSGSEPDFLTKVVQLTVQADLPLLLDNYQNAREVLSNKPDTILKINGMELAKLTGVAGIPEGLAALRREYPRVTAAITDGGRGGWLATPDAAVQEIPVPRLARPVVNPLGAGDTASAVLFAKLLDGESAPEAFRMALAAASASCLTNQAGRFDPALAQSLL